MKTKIFTRILFLFSLNFIYNFTYSQCDLEDWKALKALYLSTDGDNWFERSGWEIFENTPEEPGTDCDLANLYGVLLNTDGRVYSLLLPYNDLNGSIPKEIGDLTNLQYLELAFNFQLSGNIPDEIGNLTQLLELYLDLNQLSGDIPTGLSNLIQLEYLYLGNNQLTGNLPKELGNLSQLIEFDLNDNQLNGSIPSELENLNNLDYINLSFNNFTGDIPKELSNLFQIRGIFFDSNSLSGDIPIELSNLSNLLFLGLSDNNLTGSIPTEFGNLENLSGLNLSNNQLSGNIPAEFGNLNQLYILMLNDNNLTGCYAEELSDLCDQLSYYDYSSISEGNNFDFAWDDFCSKDLGICYNCNIDDMMALKALYNSTNGHNWDENTGWEMFENDPGESSENCNLSALYGVKLNDNDRVIELDLCSNHLRGSIPKELENLAELKYLDLKDNYLNGSLPSELGKLNQLELLWLNNNELSGNIPSELSNLMFLKSLDFRENQLSGNIPSELGVLSQLEELWLANNQLKGKLPTTLSNLNLLEDLRVSFNEISGCYPAGLSSLCDQIAMSNSEISDGNQFETTWEDFCDTGNGECTISTNIDSNEYSSNLNLQYNHVKNTINADFSNVLVNSIDLYNLNGQLIKKLDNNNASNAVIDVKNLSNGLYVVIAKSNDQLLRNKIYITN